MPDAGEDKENKDASGGDSKSMNSLPYIKSAVLQSDQTCSIRSAGPKVTYIPPKLPEDEDTIFAHYQTGINFDKYDDILVDVSGANPPQAIMVRNVQYSPIFTYTHTQSGNASRGNLGALYLAQ